MKTIKTTGIALSFCLGVILCSNTAAIAGDCVNTDSVFDEGPSQNCERRIAPVSTAKADCIDIQSFYTEGTPYPCNQENKALKTDLAYCDGNDFFCEGQGSKTAKATLASYKDKAIKAVPAAGTPKL